MLRDKKIFIVEDNAMNRAVYTIILKKAGCQIEFDRWGRDAIEKLSEESFDLVILDLMLPIGNASGYTIYERIRQLRAYDSVPIIAVSASEPSFAIPKTQELGFNGFISKPLDKNLFPTQLEQILQGETIWYAGNRY